MFAYQLLADFRTCAFWLVIVSTVFVRVENIGTVVTSERARPHGVDKGSTWLRAVL